MDSRQNEVSTEALMEQELLKVLSEAIRTLKEVLDMVAKTLHDMEEETACGEKTHRLD